MVDLTPDQLVAKIMAVAKAAHVGAYKGMQVACLARQATAMKYCTSGESPFDPMVFPTKIGGTGAPIDTGNLRAHIYMMVEDKDDEIVGGVGCGDTGKGRASVDGYAGHVHNGTSKMEARPFIELALTNEEADTKKRISDGTWDAIRQAALI